MVVLRRPCRARTFEVLKHLSVSFQVERLEDGTMPPRAENFGRLLFLGQPLGGGISGGGNQREVDGIGDRFCATNQLTTRGAAQPTSVRIEFLCISLERVLDRQKIDIEETIQALRQYLINLGRPSAETVLSPLWTRESQTLEALVSTVRIVVLRR